MKVLVVEGHTGKSKAVDIKMAIERLQELGHEVVTQSTDEYNSILGMKFDYVIVDELVYEKEIKPLDDKLKEIYKGED
jgi:menaquinone-dependent protoporphyrinogen IX oxidase